MQELKATQFRLKLECTKPRSILFNNAVEYDPITGIKFIGRANRHQKKVRRLSISAFS